MERKKYFDATLEELGFHPELEKYIHAENLSDFEIGRVIKEHKERYIVKTSNAEFEAEITGNMRFTATDRTNFPAVGDWVAFTIYDSNAAIIYKILPRTTILERQAIGKFGEKQIISTNIDFAFIMQAIDNNFNINRLDRYLAVCYSSQIEPILILSKTDLLNEQEIENVISKLDSREQKVPVILLSNNTREGYDQILSLIKKGKTYCIIGSSGVGKSTLVNNLTQKELLKTSEISQSTNKGRHTTSHRELIVLESGGILIDTPGMRELGVTENIEGIETTFDTIVKLAAQCKFIDCSHIEETGCAILKAVDDGTISYESYSNYLKLLREQQRFQTTIAEKRKKDKQFGKMCKNIMKNKKQNKF